MGFTYAPDGTAADPGRLRPQQSGAPLSTQIRAALRRGPAARQELPGFTRQLSTLLHAGTNAPEALETLRPGIASPELRRTVEALEIATKRGLPLYAAMREHPKVFDRVYTEIVAAGEQAGTLSRMLDPLADGLVAEERMRRKTRRAMIYPVFSLAATVIGGWYMVQKVVPTFASIYEREGVELPSITRVLLALSDVAGHAGEAGMLVLAAVLIAIPRVLALPAVKPRIDALMLRLPVLGRLARVRSLSNFMRYFALLLSTGSIQEVDAIELAAQTAPNHALAERLAAAAREVAMGTAKISTALQRTGVVPPTWVQVMQTGEKSGQLAQLTEFAAARLEEEAEDAVAGVQALSEPLALTIVALAVGFLVVGLYAPMANLYQVLLQ
jgi:type II secretory pathway component PulF